MAPSPYIFIISIGPVDMNKYARFDEIPSMTLKDIKETKHYGRMDNVKTVYPPTKAIFLHKIYRYLILPHLRMATLSLFLLVTQDFHLTYSKNRGNLGSESK